MPIYEYRCENGHTFDVFQSMSDDPVAECEQCGAPVERVFHPVAVHFKGSGFYTTDYGAKKKKAEGGESKGDAAKGESKGGDSKGGGSKGGGSTGDAGAKAPAKSD